MSDNSREGTPTPSNKKSRRKPVVPHRIEQDEDDVTQTADIDDSFDVEELMSSANQNDGENEESPTKTNGSDEPEVISDSKDEDFVIPEGTVIVNPEPVEEPEKKEYKGPEWKATKATRKPVSLNSIHCTACNRQINPQQSGSARRHPVLKVLLCKRCYNWYTSDEITQDDDGMDNQCRWCGDGGNLLCCDYCHNAFCKKCIKKNLGRNELSEIIDADDDAKWRCYVCDPKPLANLIEECTCLLTRLEKEQQSAREQKEKVKAKPAASAKSSKPGDPPKKMVAKKSTSKPHIKSPKPAVAPVSLLPPGSIPVQVVMGKDGQQVIVLDQPTKPANTLGTISSVVKNVAQNIARAQHGKQGTPHRSANATPNRGTNVTPNRGTNAHVRMVNQGKAVPRQSPQNRRPAVDVSKYIWEAPIDHFNITKVLDRTCSITDSLRMVMMSLKEELKKSSNFQPNIAIEKRKIVAVKLKRAMGAFKKQISDIETFAIATHNKPALLNASPGGNKIGQRSKGPFPVAVSRVPKPKIKEGEVIELSDSSDDETGPSKASTPKPAKKSFQMKVRLGGSDAGKRKRAISNDDDVQAIDADSDQEDDVTKKTKSDAPEKKKRKADDKDVEMSAREDVETVDEGHEKVGSENEIDGEAPEEVDDEEAEVLDEATGALIDKSERQKSKNEVNSIDDKAEDSNESKSEEICENKEVNSMEPETTDVAEVNDSAEPSKKNTPEEESDSEVPMETDDAPKTDDLNETAHQDSGSPEDSMVDSTEKSGENRQSSGKNQEESDETESTKETKPSPTAEKSEETNTIKSATSSTREESKETEKTKSSAREETKETEKIKSSAREETKVTEKTKSSTKEQTKENQITKPSTEEETQVNETKDKEKDTTVDAENASPKGDSSKKSTNGENEIEQLDGSKDKIKSVQPTTSKPSLRTEVTITSTEDDDLDGSATHEELFGSLKFEPLFNIGFDKNFGVVENGNVDENSDLESDYMENGDISENESHPGDPGETANKMLSEKVTNVIERNESSESDNDNDDVIERIDTSESDNDCVANDPAKRDAHDVSMEIAQSKRTRNDIEAQRELHRALLDEENSSEDENRDSEQASDSDSDEESGKDSEEKSSGEEFVPGKAHNLSRSRRETLKKKVKDKFSTLRKSRQSKQRDADDDSDDNRKDRKKSKQRSKSSRKDDKRSKEGKKKSRRGESETEDEGNIKSKRKKKLNKSLDKMKSRKHSSDSESDCEDEQSKKKRLKELKKSAEKKRKGSKRYESDNESDSDDERSKKRLKELKKSAEKKKKVFKRNESDSDSEDEKSKKKRLKELERSEGNKKKGSKRNESDSDSEDEKSKKKRLKELEKSEGKKKKESKRNESDSDTEDEKSKKKRVKELERSEGKKKKGSKGNESDSDTEDEKSKKKRLKELKQREEKKGTKQNESDNESSSEDEKSKKKHLKTLEKSAEKKKEVLNNKESSNIESDSEDGKSKLKVDKKYAQQKQNAKRDSSNCEESSAEETKSSKEESTSVKKSTEESTIEIGSSDEVKMSTESDKDQRKSVKTERDSVSESDGGSDVSKRGRGSDKTTDVKSEKGKKKSRKDESDSDSEAEDHSKSKKSSRSKKLVEILSDESDTNKKSKKKSHSKKCVDISSDESENNRKSRKKSKLKKKYRSKESDDSEDGSSKKKSKDRKPRNKSKSDSESEDDASKRDSRKSKHGKSTSKKDKERSKSETKKRKHGSDFDSDLEKEIEKLSKDPVKAKRKFKDTDKKVKTLRLEDLDAEELKSCYVKLESCDRLLAKGEDGVVDCSTLPRSMLKPTKSRWKGKKAVQRPVKRNLAEQLSSGEDEAEYDEEDEMDEVQSEDMNGDAGVVMLNGDTSGSERRARQALFADISDGSDSADSDVDAIAAKKNDTNSKSSKHKKSAATEDDDEEEEDDEEVDSDESGVVKRSKDDKWKRDKMLTEALSSDSDFAVPKKRRKKKASSEDDEEEAERSDNYSDLSSDFEAPKKKKRGRKKKSESDEEENSDSDAPKKKGKKKRRRIKKVASSGSEAGSAGSGGSGSDDDDDTKGKGRKHIRKIMGDKKISKETKTAAKIEEERRKRIKEKQKMYNQIDEEDVNSPTKAKITTKLVLEMDEDKDPIIEVWPNLIRKLKPHQVEAVRFLWDSCVEDLKRIKKEEGSGCILAHCMGLGKTLSVITFTHTLMNHEELTGINTCLILCPLNTVLNWHNEWHRWVDKKVRPEVYEMSRCKDAWSRADTLHEWHTEGGVMIMGYEMYRNLASLRNVKKKKQKEIFTKCLVDPGPDVMVCDEGHVLKNIASALSKTVNLIKTKRRVVLTGTPLQNNLVEYHCMVDFVKPKLLGTKKEFLNRFVNPITNGQHKDSTSYDVKLMKKRAHILHETLAGCVQRKDYSALTKFLLPKHEYVLCIRLSETQMDLYESYLNRVGHGPLEGEKLRSAQLFKDYQFLMRIWTHPWILKLQEIREENKRVDDDESDFIDDEEDSEMDSFLDDSSSEKISNSDNSDDSDRPKKKKKGKGKKHIRANGRRRLGRAAAGDDSASDVEKDDDDDTEKDDVSKKDEEEESQVSSEWWARHVKEEDKQDHSLSGKLVLLAEVLRLSEAIGDKVLVFSQSLLSLDLIEDFLSFWDQSRDDEDEAKATISGTGQWVKNIDYFRMDGSTNAQNRKFWADTLNDENNLRARLFLISTRAGSLGTNLVGANRVIVFDASWNPSHDTQSIFRVYRFGQTKPTYIYRFLAQGTMEEKIYERQVMKQSLSQRVVDEQQVARHFTSADLAELYNFTPEKWDAANDEYIPILPKDRLLADLLTEQKMWIVKYHEHDSLLENKVEEDLTEEERKTAWEEYEEEKKHGYRTIVRGPSVNPNTQQFYNHYNLQQPAYGMGPTNAMYGYGASALPQALSMNNIEMVAKAIYAANPGLTPDQLQLRVQNYVQQQARQQQYFMQRQNHEARMQQEMAKLKEMQAQRVHQQNLLASYQNAPGAAGASNYAERLQSLVGSGSSPALTTLDDAPQASSSGMRRTGSGSNLVSVLKKPKK